jgi:hypothetical protein
MSAPSPGLFPDLPRLAPIAGPCVACRRKAATLGWTTADPPDAGGAASSVGLCEPCARLVEHFQLARDQAHEVARRARSAVRP